jgi:hypothetical protein
MLSQPQLQVVQGANEDKDRGKKSTKLTYVHLPEGTVFDGEAVLSQPELPVL